MMILNKLKTAKRVLFGNGIGEVWALLVRNIEQYSLRFFRFSASKFGRALYRYLLRHFQSKTDGRIKILYVTNKLEAEFGQTARYRIYNLIKSTQGLVKAKVEIIENGVYRDAWAVRRADIIVLMRVDWSPMTEKLVEKARRNEVPIVYDIDDIIFLPEYAANYCTVLNDTFQRDINKHTEKFARYEKSFKSCKLATTSTYFIAGIMEQQGKKVYVIHNGFNQKQFNIAKSLKKVSQPYRYIGYLSGSESHNRDFAQALPAIIKIMNEFEDVRLRVVGYLDLSVLPPEIAAKTQIACYMKWTKLLRHSAANYINIAPLDIDNPFCHAKSELKYFEAAIVGVPTVASSTDTFKRCITHGVNGMLAANSDQWYSSIKALLDDSQLYENIQKNAYEQAVESYSPQAVAKEVMIAYQGILREYKS
jgi:glycosyltransferase involved in cell wall biosynthesis